MLKETLLNLKCFIDNEYLDYYVELIDKNIKTNAQPHKTNRHQIIPRAYYKLNSLPIDDSEGNICNLLYSDHIRAHYYLLKCSYGAFKSKCYLAFQFIYGKYSNEDINQLTEFDWNYIQECHEQSRYEDSINKKGIPKPQSVKDKISKANKGKKASPETRYKISQSLKGREPWNKGGKGIRTKGCSGQHWYNDGNINILSFECPDGYTPGRIYVRKNTCISDKTREKMSSAKKGRCYEKDNNKAHRVLMFSLNDVYLRAFDTIKEAENYVGAVGVGAVIKGKQKTCGGYKWKDGK